jgi:Protein of unknown function (DUF4058)
MPLRDHFHPPLSGRRPFASFRATWAAALADALNRDLLPRGYVALEFVQAEEAEGPAGSRPERAAVEIHATEGGRTLLAAIELVSPGNKDRESKRRQFAAKCVTYLGRGIGLVVLDVVTSRQGNLHNELTTLLGLEASLRMPADVSLYAVSYRPLRRDQVDQIETWPMPLAVGRPLPTVPLSLAAEWCVAVDLEGPYLEACRRRRLNEVTG